VGSFTRLPGTEGGDPEHQRHACQFYERHGFELRSINPNAYPDLPDGVQMLWYRCVA
jgi:hypothetical protein